MDNGWNENDPEVGVGTTVGIVLGYYIGATIFVVVVGLVILSIIGS